jgi:hypothetical protein
MTEEQKKFLKEIGDINDGISIYSRKKLRETFPELFEQSKPERYHIDVRIECDKVKDLDNIDLKYIKSLVFGFGYISTTRNATITEIPQSETIPLTRELFVKIWEDGFHTIKQYNNKNILWNKIKSGKIK